MTEPARDCPDCKGSKTVMVEFQGRKIVDACKRCAREEDIRYWKDSGKGEAA